jgi:hypothetical protein
MSASGYRAVEIYAWTLDQVSPSGLKVAMLGPLVEVGRPENLELARPFLDGDGCGRSR